MKLFKRLKILVLALTILTLLSLTPARARAGEIGSDGTKILGEETIRTKDEKGNVIEKHIVKKIKARTVVDFEEASIEGKVKKPNAAYLLHGADLDFKHLYQIKHNQRNRIMTSYDYLR